MCIPCTKSSPFLTREGITEEKLSKIKALNEIATGRGQSLAQMACAWNLRGGRLTSVLLGASRPEQIIDSAKSLTKLDFTEDELAEIDRIVKD